MTLPIIIRPDAEADMAAARAWYERQRSGLGDAFIAAVDAQLLRIQAMPELYAVVAKTARNAPIPRFSYLVLYRMTDDMIEVLAVMHTGRDPQTWQSRI